IEAVTCRPPCTHNRKLRQSGIPFLPRNIKYYRRIENLSKEWRIKRIKNINNANPQLRCLFSFRLRALRGTWAKYILRNFRRNPQCFQFAANGVKDKFRGFEVFD